MPRIYKAGQVVVSLSPNRLWGVDRDRTPFGPCMVRRPDLLAISVLGGGPAAQESPGLEKLRKTGPSKSLGKPRGSLQIRSHFVSYEIALPFQ
jgi:hypothetical protein